MLVDCILVLPHEFGEESRGRVIVGLEEFRKSPVIFYFIPWLPTSIRLLIFLFLRLFIWDLLTKAFPI